jgi:hypothetical protein
LEGRFTALDKEATGTLDLWLYREIPEGEIIIETMKRGYNQSPRLAASLNAPDDV